MIREEARPWLPLLAAVGAVVLLQQVADVAVLLPATDLATPAGRVRQLLAVEARSPGLVAADLLLLSGMVLGRSALRLRVAGAVHLAGAVVLLVLFPVFLFDAGSLAAGFGGSEASAFQWVVARTLLMLAGFGLVGLGAGRALFRLAAAP